MFLYKFFRKLSQHLKYQRIIKEAYEREQLIAKISLLLGVQFKLDWINRLYAVVNPNIKDGKYNPEQIYEFDFDGNPYNNEWVTKWVMERMGILRNFLQTANLFDVLEYKIKDLGNLNYLVIFQPITLTFLLKSIRPAIIELLIIILLILLWVWI